jgi:hypothetical protein
MALELDGSNLTRKVRKFFIWIMAIAVLALLGYFGIANITYSEGVRAGSVIKISKKGVFIKTYEGELAMSSVGGYMMQPNQMGNTWSFSVKNKAVFEKIISMEGKQVTLKYKEKMRTFPWLGETRYFVYDVEPIEDQQLKPNK